MRCLPHVHRWLIAAALVTAVAPSACRREAAEEVESEAAVSVVTVPATRGDIRGIVHATGIVTPAPGAELIVIAPEPARIAAIQYAAGDRVRRGDVLVRFEIPGPIADVQKQQAEVTRADAALNTARAAETRARALFERGVAARREIEEASHSVADAEAAVAQARAGLAAAQTTAARSTVRATFDGVIAQRHHNPGDLVEAAASDPILRVVDPRRLEVIASVPLTDASRIDVDAPARIVSVPLDTAAVILKVASRPTAVEAGTATVPVRLAFGAPASLPVGAPVQIDIDAEQHRGVVLVPASAIVREGDETAVFIAKDGRAQRRKVAVGLADSMHLEIVSGVSAGESVIVDGQAGLPDNAAISARNGTGAETEQPEASAQDKRP